MRLTATSLVGRELEREVVVDLIERAADGLGGAAALVAEPGLGKSRLLREIERHTADRGGTFAIGRATAGLPAPFRPVTEALLAIDRARGRRELAAAAGHSPGLARLVPAAGSSGRNDPAEATIPVVGDALLSWLESTRDDGAVVLALEDLHWADDETLALVEFLVDNVATTHVAIAATMRPDPDRASRVFRNLEVRNRSLVVELRPLDRLDVSTLVRDCLGGAVMPDVERFVEERCDGNPLYVEELLAGLRSSGSLVYGSGGWRVETRITSRAPLTLTEAVSKRWSALAPDDRGIVGAAAMLGRRFDWRTVQAITENSGALVLAALRRAEDVQLVEFRDGRHQFRHALTCDVIRDLVPAEERERLARRGLDRLGDGADSALLAELAEQSGDHAEAVTRLRALAADHLDRGALASAADVMRRAELLAVAPIDRVDVAIDLAGALLLAGDGVAARETCRAAMTLLQDVTGDWGVDERLVRLHLLLARAAIVLGEWSRAAEVVASVDTAGASTAAQAEADAVAAHVCLNIGDFDEATRCAESAVQRALTVGRPEIACEAMEAIGRSARFRDPDESTRSFRRAIEIADDAGLDVWRLRATHEIAINEAFLEWRFDRLEQLRSDAAASGAVLTLAVVELHDAGSLLIGGDIAEARAATMRCLDACRRYRLSMLPMALIHLAAVSAFSGDREMAGAAVDEALTLAPDDLDIRSQVAGWVDATFALVDGDLEAWWRHLDRGMEIVGDSSATIPSPWRGQWALAAAVRGDDGPARRLAASHAAFVAANRVALEMVEAVRLSRAGQMDEAGRQFDAADEELRGARTDLPRHLARVLVAPVAADCGWGEPADWLRAADAWSADAGFEGLHQTIRATMRQLDVPVPRRGRGESVVPPALRQRGVTTREMDVLLLVATGCSNREIGGRLHLSVRTVEKHVASLLAKTASSDRRALSALMATAV